MSIIQFYVKYNLLEQKLLIICHDFLDDYTDDLLYIIEDLKSRFSTSPFFISNINLPILTNYMINCIFKKNLG